MDELVTWLRACLDEDERAAKAATGRDWYWSNDAPAPAKYMLAADDGQIVLPIAPSDVWPQKADAEHIVRHDPARVLREVEAKRRILDMDDRQPVLYPDDEAAVALQDVLKMLALVYASRDGYREEWRP